jgi:hypothetical protein
MKYPFHTHLIYRMVCFANVEYMQGLSRSLSLFCVMAVWTRGQDWCLNGWQWMTGKDVIKIFAVPSNFEEKLSAVM